jgi:hypothetical protein
MGEETEYGHEKSAGRRRQFQLVQEPVRQSVRLSIGAEV